MVELKELLDDGYMPVIGDANGRVVMFDLISTASAFMKRNAKGWPCGYVEAEDYHLGAIAREGLKWKLLTFPSITQVDLYVLELKMRLESRCCR